MARTPFTTGTNVVVAVQLDDLAPALIRAGAQVAEKTGGKLTVVHVCEPTNPVAWSYAMGGGFGLESVATIIEDQQIDAATTELKSIVAAIKTTCPVTQKVITGNPASVVAGEASSSGASLIVTGASPGTHRFVPSGLSTALSLMGHATCAVLVMTRESKFDLSRKGFKVLVADDLRDTSHPALSAAYAAAVAAGPGAELLQTHVNGLTRESLAAGLEAALASSRATIASDKTAEEVFGMMMKSIENKLVERLSGIAWAKPPAGLTCKKMVCTGNVTEELEKVLGTFAADLVVYGRHQTFHHKPFMVGQVPFFSVLAHKRPVLVVPAE